MVVCLESTTATTVRPKISSSSGSSNLNPSCSVYPLEGNTSVSCPEPWACSYENATIQVPSQEDSTNFCSFPLSKHAKGADGQLHLRIFRSFASYLTNHQIHNQCLLTDIKVGSGLDRKAVLTATEIHDHFTSCSIHRGITLDLSLLINNLQSDHMAKNRTLVFLQKSAK